MRVGLLHEFAFLPSEVFASAFSAFRGGCGVSDSAISADFHVEPVLLRYGFLNRI